MRTRLLVTLVGFALATSACTEFGTGASTTAVSVVATAPPAATTTPVAGDTELPVASTTLPPTTTSTTAVVTTTTAPPTTTTVAPTTTTVAERVEVFDVGVGTPISVAAVLPMSGAFGDMGLDQANGIRLAAETFGDIQGRPIQVIAIEDTRCSVDGGRSAARAIAATGAVTAGSPIVGIIGPGCGASAIDAVPILTEAGFAVVSPSVVDADFTSDLFGTPGRLRSDGFFRVGPNDLLVALAAADYARYGVDADRAAVITVADDVFGARWARTFEAWFEDHGGDLVGFVEVPSDLAGARAALAALADEDPEVVFLGVGPGDTSTVAEQIQAIEAFEDVVRLVPGSVLLSPAASAPATEGAIFAFPEDEPEGTDALGVDYVAMSSAYELAFGAPPSLDAVRAYDATLLLLSAVDRAANTTGSRLTIDRAEIRSTLGSVRVASLLGALECDSFGDCGPGIVRFLEHEDPSQPGTTLDNEIWRYEP